MHVAIVAGGLVVGAVGVILILALRRAAVRRAVALLVRARLCPDVDAEIYRVPVDLG
jgi:hypothetical protein